jgi:hypothetical protein
MPGGSILSLHTSSSSLLVLSSQPSPGVETVFHGRGECVDSPPPSTPSSPSELEIHLHAVFSSCDPYKTGLVSSANLVEYLSSLVDLQDMERWKVEELSRMLDPTGENRCVDQQIFITVGRDWVEMVVPKEENKVGVQIKEERESRSDGKDLRHQLDRLREEYSVLLMTSAVADEQVATLTMEVRQSRSKETSLERGLLKAGAVFEEIDDLKIISRRLEEQKDSLTDNQELLIMENDCLKKQLEDERNNLISFRKVLEEMRDNETNLKADLFKKDVKNQEILNMEEEANRQLKTEILKNEQLECSLSLLSEQLEMALSAAAVKGDSCHSQSSCQLLDTSQDDAVAEGSEQLLLSSATPEMINPAIPATITSNQEGLGSIMEEIEEVVVKYDLPSPICKKEVRWSEVEVMRMKSRLLEMVKAKFGSENNLWITSFEREIEVGISAVLEAEEEADDSDLKEDAEAEEMTVGVLFLRR